MKIRWWKNPDVWSVFIALCALVISVLTWLDTQKQLKQAIGQGKSNIQIESVKLLEPITDASYIKLQLQIKNFGLAAADSVYGEMDYSLGGPDFEGKGNSATRLDFGTFAPGMERTVTLKSNKLNDRDWPPPQFRFPPTIYFYGTIWYTDDISKEKKKEDWCYKLELRKDPDLEKTDLELEGILKYKSK